MNNKTQGMAILVLSCILTACSSFKVVERPIVFDKDRADLSLEYLEKRHGIKKEEPSITPKMVVVHHTVIPTADKTYQAFYGPMLPSARKGIQSASSLNVSSQYMIDRDGTVYRLLPDTVFARHVIGLNHCAIGIENVGGTDDLPLTDRQLKSNVKLIRQLSKEHPIEYVIGHHEYQEFIGHELWKETDPNYLTVKSDPGEDFMMRLRKEIKDLNLKGPPAQKAQHNLKSIDPHHWHETYDQFKEISIKDRRFTHSDIQPLLERASKHPHFKLKKVGESVEGRSISLLSYGQGDVSVYLWSQMHGDEATATMALMDIFNYLADDQMDKEFKALLRSKISLHFIPMLNPDGAERFQRRNVMGVDLNRDALRLQNPEARILKAIRDSLDADWGFNLHDQSRYYAVGIQPDVAAISFLAPAYNYEKDINEVRGNAMKLIGVMNDVMQQYAPGKIAKYNDDFEPRAFGDNIQKWGTSTILIESGGMVGDREKQKLRQLNYVSLLAAFQSIALGTFQEYGLDNYHNIPFNNSNTYHELIIRNGTVMREGIPYILDVAYRLNERPYGDEGAFYMDGSIVDIGDLSTSYGYEEFDASGYTIEPGNIGREPVISTSGMNPGLKDGITDYLLKEIPEPWTLADHPMRYHMEAEDVDNSIQVGNNASLVLKKNGVVEFAVINGRLIKVK
jgi:hypothetical protein